VQVCGRTTGTHSLCEGTWQGDPGCRDPGRHEPHSLLWAQGYPSLSPPRAGGPAESSSSDRRFP